jgi:hypothetical protein
MMEKTFKLKKNIYQNEFEDWKLNKKNNKI